MPDVWLIRFDRTVSHLVVVALQNRLSAPRQGNQQALSKASGL